MEKKKLMIAIMIFMAMFNVQAQVGEPGEAWTTRGNFATDNRDFLGTITNYPFSLKTNDAVRMYFDTNGNIGVNTSIPYQMLHVVDGNIMITGSSTRAPGSPNGSMLFGSTADTSDHFGRWGIEYLCNENDGYGLNFWRPWTPSIMGGNYYLFLSDSGNVGIGTKNPQARLAVNGDLLAKSIRVNTSSTYWPDYVFENDYQLMSIEELNAYIAQNHHLPNIPSAKEIEEKGEVNLEAMNALLLEKVEELTRYIIDLQKQIDSLGLHPRGEINRLQDYRMMDYVVGRCDRM